MRSILISILLVLFFTKCINESETGIEYWQVHVDSISVPEFVLMPDSIEIKFFGLVAPAAGFRTVDVDIKVIQNNYYYKFCASSYRDKRTGPDAMVALRSYRQYIYTGQTGRHNIIALNPDGSTVETTFYVLPFGLRSDYNQPNFNSDFQPLDSTFYPLP